MLIAENGKVYMTHALLTIRYVINFENVSYCWQIKMYKHLNFLNLILNVLYNIMLD